RHTRSKRDWSSDVCSSDLTIGLGVFIFTEPLVRLFIQDQAAVTFASDYLRIMVFCFPFLGINFVLNGIIRASGAMYQVLILNIRSEERRVGKECRTEWE